MKVRPRRQLSMPKETLRMSPCCLTLPKKLEMPKKREMKRLKALNTLV